MACGQQSEVVGPHQRVEYDGSLNKFVTSTTQTLSGICDPGGEILVTSSSVVGGQIAIVCDPRGQFSVDVVLTSGDGDKAILVTQTAKQTGAITTDEFIINLDQNPPVLTADVAPLVSYGSGLIVSNVLSNDVDAGRGLDPSSLAIVVPDMGTVNGICSIFFGAVPTVSFLPDQGFSGTAVCAYQVSDLLGQTSSTTVTFSIGASTPVVANDNIVGGTQNIPVSVDVIADDVDADGTADIDLSTFEVITGTNPVTVGTCAVGPAPSMLTFTPVTNFYGTAVCTYQVCDFAGGCDTATFSVITPDATVPVAVRDIGVVSSGGTPITMDVAANDTDAANNVDPSSVSVQSASGGVCSLSPTAPNIQFTPASGFVGLANCTYRICDSQPNCTTGVFEVTVNDGQAPNTNNDLAITTANNATSSINVSLNDLDAENQLDLSSVTIVGATDVNGACAISPASPLVVFTPALNFIGTGGCDYQICDASANCSTSSIVVTVNDVNPPTAMNDSHSTNQNTPATSFDVSTNDTDLEVNLDPSSVSLTGIESGGSCTVTPPNVDFTPALDFSGLASCGYRICDNAGNCSQASLNVTVSDVTAPTVTINQLTPGQMDPTNTNPISFSLAFSEEISVASLTSSDLDTSGSTATGGIFTFLNTGDNQNFILQVSALGAEGTIVVSLPVGTFEDLNGVTNTAASTDLDNSVYFDNAPPLKPIVLSPDFTTDATPDVSISCETGTLLQISAVNLTPNPYPASPVTCAGGAHTFLAVPFTGGSPYIVNAISSDPSGNQTISDVFNIAVDALSPDVDVNVLSGQPVTTNLMPIFFEAVFSEAVDATSFNALDITNSGTAPGGVWTILNSGDDITFTLSINALTGDGTVIPSIAFGLVSDLAGNLNTVSTSSTGNTVTYDGTVPSAPIITNPFFTQNPTPTLTVDCETNENLEFVITPYGGTNPVMAVCTGGSASVVIPASVGADGSYTILPTAIDGVMNRTDGNLFTMVLDRGDPAPTITLNAGQSTLTNSSPVFFDVVWDEPIDGSTFTGIDITNTGTATGGVWSVANSGDNQNFVISVTSLTGDGTVIPQIAAGVSNDQALNLNLIGAYAGTAVTLDTAAPDQPVATSPAFTLSATPTVSVNCDVTSASVNLIIPGYAGSPVAGGACSSSPLSIPLVTALSTETTYTVTPVATDAAGNVSTGSPFSMVFDQSAPTVVLDRLVSQPAQTNLAPVSFSVVFSEAIDPGSFTSVDITEINGSPAPGGTWSITNSGDNTNFTISKSGLTGDGFIQPQVLASSVLDPTGNTNALVSSVGSNGDTVEYIVTPPGTPTVISPAYTNTLSPTVTVACEVGALIQLSISGYAPDPFPAFPVTCTASPISIPITPAVASEGTYTVRAIAEDNIGNQSISIPFDVVVDTTQPTVVIAQAGGQLDPTRLMPIIYDVTFSEAIDATSFTAVDITNAGSTSGVGSWSISNSGDDTNFTISLSGLTSDGTVEPRLLVGVVDDKASNVSVASLVPPATDLEIEYDGTPPGIPVILSPRYINNTGPSISVSCDVGSDVQVQSATINGGVAFPVAPVNCVASPVVIVAPGVLTDGDYTLTALASDAVGNISYSSAYTMTVDTIKPDVTVDRLAVTTPDRTNSLPVVFSVAFSESINTATFNSAVISNAVGALTPGLWAVTNSGDDTNFTISASAVSGAGNIEPQILAGLVQDLAGNTNNIYTVLADGDVYFDNVIPGDADITSWTWALSSPLNGAYSTDNTPIIDLTGGASENGGVIQMYDDVTCTSSAGSAVAISAGAANVPDISYLVDGSEDGLKPFYVRVTDDVGNIGNCVPVAQSYTFDTTAPIAFINQALTQSDPATDLPIFFDVLFDEEIDPLTFTVADVVNNGTIGSLTFAVVNSGDNKKFSVQATGPDTGGTVILEMTGVVEDLAGNLSGAPTYADDTVSYNCVNPEAITDMYYGPVTQTTADLFWTPKPTIGCKAVLDYEVEFREAGGVWAVFVDSVTPDPLATVTGLLPDTDYEFRIRASNDLLSGYSNIVEVSTKTLSPFFDPSDYKLINLTGATDSTVVALEDSTDIYITTDVNDPAPALLASLDAGETHQFASVQGEILISTNPMFATGRVGSYTFGCSGSGNPPWVPPLWSEKTLLFNASRNSPQTVYVFAFEDANVTIFRNNAVVVPSTFIAANTFTALTAAGTGSFKIEADGFIAATRHGTTYVDDMPALPKATQIMGYPSNAGLLSTVSPTSINATLYHSDGFSLIAPVVSSNFTSMSPRGATTSLYRSEALFVEADDLISASNTADSDGCNSAPFNPINLMMRRYAVNVDSQYVAFASTYPADIKMTRPDGTEADFSLVRTGTGPFALKAPYKYYLTNIEAGTRFEGYTPLDRYSVWYQSDTRDGAGYEDETIIYGYK